MLADSAPGARHHQDTAKFLDKAAKDIYNAKDASAADRIGRRKFYNDKNGDEAAFRRWHVQLDGYARLSEFLTVVKQNACLMYAMYCMLIHMKSINFQDTLYKLVLFEWGLSTCIGSSTGWVKLGGDQNHQVFFG